MNMIFKEHFDALCEHGRELNGIDIRYSKGKKGKVVLIKAVIINVMIRLYKISLSELGIDLLKRDHTYPLYHRDNHKGRYQSDDEYADLYDRMVKFALNRKTTQTQLGIDDILVCIKAIAA